MSNYEDYETEFYNEWLQNGKIYYDQNKDEILIRRGHRLYKQFNKFFTIAKLQDSGKYKTLRDAELTRELSASGYIKIGKV